MSISAGEVKVGHCYALPDGSQRKVAALVDGRVKFAGMRPTQGQADMPTIEAFAGQVRSEVACADPGPEPTPGRAEG